MTALAAVDDSPMWAPPGPEESRALAAAVSTALVDSPAHAHGPARLHPDDLSAIANRVVHLIDLRRMAREIAADLVEPVAARVATLLGMVAP